MTTTGRMNIRSFIVIFWKPIIISLIITTLCLIPSEELQKIDIFKITYEDLLAHFIMFFAFSVVLAYDLLKHLTLSKRIVFVSTISLSVSLLLGLTTEILQYLLIHLNRTANIGDLLFDSLGSIAGVLTIRFIKR